MTDKDVISIAMRQSAIDSNCAADDFLKEENRIVISKQNPQARKYLELPFLCDFTSYGNNVVASVSPELQGIAGEYLSQFSAVHCFETPNLHVLMETLRVLQLNICFMAEYFLPSAEIKPLGCRFETRILSPKDFSCLYLPQWSNALCEDRKHLDILGVGAYHNGELIGLAACSADCDTMWQIGVDVLPAYRRQGIASAVTSRLAYEILARDIVPFYCCAWSNIQSAKNAIRSGFLPAWVQLTVKSDAFIARMNQQIS